MAAVEHSAAAIFWVSVSFMRKNNFNLIRLLAACLVLAGHMGPILGIASPTLGSQGLHAVGVQVLFAMGGYLIANSWRNDPNFGRFFMRRFLRLWPPFAVMVLLLAFVAGPLLSTLGPKGYFASWWTSWLKNLRFYSMYAQPGVFENNPMPLVSNGSIWTMPVEAAAYVITPILMLLFLRGRSRPFLKAGILTTIFCAADTALIASGAQPFVFYGTDWVAGFHLLTYFVIGIFCSFEELRKVLHLQAAPIFLVLILITTEIRSAALQWVVWLISLPYLVFSFALTEKPLFWKLGAKIELSYGIYLYGFFFQQLVVFWCLKYGRSWSYIICFGISLALSAGTAVLNCILIENPLLKLSRRLTAAMKNQEKSRVTT